MKYNTMWASPTIKQIRYNAALRKMIAESGISLTETEKHMVNHFPNTKYQYAINIQELINILEKHNVSVSKKKVKETTPVKEEPVTAIPVLYPTYPVKSRTSVSTSWNRTYNKRFYSF